MKDKGFTLIEIVIALAMMSILSGAVFFVYSGCLRAYNVGETRSTLRTEVAEALDIVVQDLRQMTALGTNSTSSVIYTADYGAGAGSNVYRIHAWPSSADPAIYDLRRGLSAGDGVGTIILTGLQSDSIFTLTGGNMMTIDLNALREGCTIRMQTKAFLRNI